MTYPAHLFISNANGSATDSLKQCFHFITLLSLFALAGLRFLLICLCSLTLAIIGNIETASLKYNRSRVKDAPGSALALGTHRLRLFIKALLHFKTKAAMTTLILINRHIDHLA